VVARWGTNASELLEISSEEELEQFLGGLIKKVGGFVRGPVGQALGGVLKDQFLIARDPDIDLGRPLRGIHGHRGALPLFQHGRDHPGLCFQSGTDARLGRLSIGQHAA